MLPVGRQSEGEEPPAGLAPELGPGIAATPAPLPVVRQNPILSCRADTLPAGEQKQNVHGISGS